MNTRGVEDGTEKLCKYCDLPIRETHQGDTRNEWEHMSGLSFCAGGKHWAWPAAVPVEERTRVLMEALKAVESERLECHDEAIREEDCNTWFVSDGAYSRAIRDAENAIKALITTPVPEERTAEMEQLLRRLVDAAHDEKDVIALAVYSTRGLASIVQEAKALLLDHIEGKAESIQEVKE